MGDSDLLKKLREKSQQQSESSQPSGEGGLLAALRAKSASAEEPSVSGSVQPETPEGEDWILEEQSKASISNAPATGVTAAPSPFKMAPAPTEEIKKTQNLPYSTRAREYQRRSPEEMAAERENATTTLANDMFDSAHEMPDAYHQMMSVPISRDENLINKLTNPHGNPQELSMWLGRRMGTLERRRDSLMQQHASTGEDLSEPIKQTNDKIEQLRDHAGKILDLQIFNKEYQQKKMADATFATKRASIINQYEEEKKKIEQEIDATKNWEHPNGTYAAKERNRLQFKIDRAKEQMEHSLALQESESRYNPVLMGMERKALMGDRTAAQDMGLYKAGKQIDPERRYEYQQTGRDIINYGIDNTVSESVRAHALPHADVSGQQLASENQEYIVNRARNDIANKKMADEPWYTPLTGTKTISRNDIRRYGNELNLGEDVIFELEKHPEEIPRTGTVYQFAAKGALNTIAPTIYQQGLSALARGYGAITGSGTNVEEQLSNMFGPGWQEHRGLGAKILGNVPSDQNSIRNAKGVLGTMAETVGMLVPFGGASEGVSKTLQGYGLTEKVAERGANFGLMALEGYNNAYNESRDLIGDSPEDEKSRQLYSILSGITQGALFSIHPPSRFVKGALGEAKVTGEQFLNEIKQKGIDGVMSKEFVPAYAKYIKEFAKGQGLIVSQADANLMAQNGLKNLFSKNKSTEITDGLGEETLKTSLSFLIPSLTSAIGTVRSQTPLNKAVIFDIASDPAKFRDFVDKQLADKAITPFQASQMRDGIDMAERSIQNVPITTDKGATLTPDQIKDYTFNLMQEEVLQRKLDKIQKRAELTKIPVDKAQENPIKASMAELLKQREGILEHANLMVEAQQEKNNLGEKEKPVTLPSEEEGIPLTTKENENERKSINNEEGAENGTSTESAGDGQEARIREAANNQERQQQEEDRLLEPAQGTQEMEGAPANQAGSPIPVSVANGRAERTEKAKIAMSRAVDGHPSYGTEIIENADGSISAGATKGLTAVEGTRVLFNDTEKKEYKKIKHSLDLGDITRPEFSEKQKDLVRRVLRRGLEEPAKPARVGRRKFVEENPVEEPKPKAGEVPNQEEKLRIPSGENSAKKDEFISDLSKGLNPKSESATVAMQRSPATVAKHGGEERKFFVTEKIARKAYDAYAKMEGEGVQPYETIIKRGGFDVAELDQLVPSWKEDLYAELHPEKPEQENPIENVASESPKEKLRNTHVKDKNGEPLTVFHGTKKKVDKLSANAPMRGLFFTSSKNIAESYGDDVRSANINIENPIVIDAKGADWSSIEVPINKMYDPRSQKQPMARMSTDQILETLRGKHFPEILHNLTGTQKKADGVIIKNVKDKIGGGGEASDLYIPFSDEQIFEHEKPTENASTQTKEQQQEGVQQGGEPEHARTEQTGSEGASAEAENSNSPERSAVKEKKVAKKRKEPTAFEELMHEPEEQPKPTENGIADVTPHIMRTTKGAYIHPSETIKPGTRVKFQKGNKVRYGTVTDKVVKRNAVNPNLIGAYKIKEHTGKKPFDFASFNAKTKQLRNMRLGEPQTLEEAVLGHLLGGGTFRMGKEGKGIERHLPTRKGTTENKGARRWLTAHEDRETKNVANADTFASEFGDGYSEADIADILSQYTNKNDILDRLIDIGHERELAEDPYKYTTGATYYDSETGKHETILLDTRDPDVDEQIAAIEVGDTSEQPFAVTDEGHPIYLSGLEMERSIDELPISSEDRAVFSELLDQNITEDGDLDYEGLIEDVQNDTRFSEPVRKLLKNMADISKGEEAATDLINKALEYERAKHTRERATFERESAGAEPEQGELEGRAPGEGAEGNTESPEPEKPQPVSELPETEEEADRRLKEIEAEHKRIDEALRIQRASQQLEARKRDMAELEDDVEAAKKHNANWHKKQERINKLNEERSNLSKEEADIQRAMTLKKYREGADAIREFGRKLTAGSGGMIGSFFGASPKLVRWITNGVAAIYEKYGNLHVAIRDTLRQLKESGEIEDYSNNDIQKLYDTLLNMERPLESAPMLSETNRAIAAEYLDDIQNKNLDYTWQDAIDEILDQDLSNKTTADILNYLKWNMQDRPLFNGFTLREEKHADGYLSNYKMPETVTGTSKYKSGETLEDVFRENVQFDKDSKETLYMQNMVEAAVDMVGLAKTHAGSEDPLIWGADMLDQIERMPEGSANQNSVKKILAANGLNTELNAERARLQNALKEAGENGNPAIAKRLKDLNKLIAQAEIIYRDIASSAGEVMNAAQAMRVIRNTYFAEVFSELIMSDAERRSKRAMEKVLSKTDIPDSISEQGVSRGNNEARKDVAEAESVLDTEAGESIATDLNPKEKKITPEGKKSKSVIDRIKNLGKKKKDTTRREVVKKADAEKKANGYLGGESIDGLMSKLAEQTKKPC